MNQSPEFGKGRHFASDVPGEPEVTDQHPDDDDDSSNFPDDTDDITENQDTDKYVRDCSGKSEGTEVDGDPHETHDPDQGIVDKIQLGWRRKLSKNNTSQEFVIDYLKQK